MPAQGAVFLDRDGTLIEDRGHLSSMSDVVFYPETVPALLRLQLKFRLFIITNQSGVAKGLITLQDVFQINDFVTSSLRQAGVTITAVYVCPHQRSDNCECIKPKAFFLERAARDYAIDLRQSYTVGDHGHDVDLAHNVGATGIYVLTGHGQKHRQEIPPGQIVLNHIGEAADWILGQSFYSRSV